jgi:hypothetical protein
MTASGTLTDEDLLHQLGAIERTSNGPYFTKAGVLFFSVNPQRTIPSASIRLLRFDSSVNDENHGPPSLDKMFTGPITKQLRDFRSVIRESALFKVYQVRRPDGGFAEEAEFPPVAVDEAVVNAVAHRDYALSWPIECFYYRDAFVVRNAGSIIQRNTPVASSDVIPDLPVRLIQQVLAARNMRFDLSREIKQQSLSASPAAARIRSERTQSMVEEIGQAIFPIRFAGMEAVLASTPLKLVRDARVADGLHVRTIPEPNVEFGHRKETPDVRDGITRFGAYEDEHREIELVPLVDARYRSQIASLIERLKTGKYKYRGSERTFSTRFTYGDIVTVPSSAAVYDECRRLVAERREWLGDPTLRRIMLVHTPEAGFASDDVASPYFRVKRLLLESGIPCQMVDTPTLENPDWKDLNLALNLVAKCGVTPWVLPEGIPDADFFVGLSYTQSRGDGAARLMGYANVFNEFGKWLFYSGNTQAFSYDERTRRLGLLVKDTLKRLKLSPTPNIYFHYSARFSREDRDAILTAAREIAPNGVYTFVWINTHHPVRLYDSRPETDGSLSRGSYAIGSPNQVYLSTTGYNPYRKAMGTPVMLEINARRCYPQGAPDSPLDLRALASQILALTKLNWSSTDSLCGEPITTKYAGDIAYLTAAFLRQGETFKLHPVLEPTPWFI